MKFFGECQNFFCDPFVFLGSPARGCDPMPNSLIKQLIQEGCPNATTTETKKTFPQRVYRFYRKIDKSRGVDECQSYVFPYCPEVDFNLWRSPRNVKECQEYCYSEEERLILGFIQSQKQQAHRQRWA